MYQCVSLSPLVSFVKTGPLKVCSCTLTWKTPNARQSLEQSYCMLFMVQVVCIEVRIDLIWWWIFAHGIDWKRQKNISYLDLIELCIMYFWNLDRPDSEKPCTTQPIRKMFTKNSQFWASKNALTLWARYMKFVVGFFNENFEIDLLNLINWIFFFYLI